VVTSSEHADRESEYRRFGRRITLFCEVVMTAAADPATCWIESHSEGWVFFAPLSANSAILQATVAFRPDSAEETLEEMIARTCYVRRLVDARATPVRFLASAPATRSPCGRWGRLAAGKAAMSLDPLCGDGTGQAVRAGLLAAAVIASIVDGEPGDAMLGHFNQRLEMTFGAHLRACANFYRSDVFGDCWNEEIAMVQTAARDAASSDEATLAYEHRDLRLTPKMKRST
jgi:flavin-dependent dehydrogenase